MKGKNNMTTFLNYLPYLSVFLFGFILMIIIRIVSPLLNGESIPDYILRQFLISMSAISITTGVVLLLMKRGSSISEDWTFYMAAAILVIGIGSKLNVLYQTMTLQNGRHPYTEYAVLDIKIKPFSLFNMIWIIFILLETASTFIIGYFKFQTMTACLVLTGIILLLDCLLLYDINKRINKSVEIYIEPPKDYNEGDQ